MKTINTYLIERLKLDKNSKIEKKNYGIDDLISLLNNHKNYHGQSIITLYNLEFNNGLSTGKIGYYKYRGEKTMIFCFDKERNNIKNLVLKNNKDDKVDKIGLYYLNVKFGDVKIIDFSEPNKIKTNINDINYFYVNDVNGFANNIIEMINSLYETYSEEGRIEKVKKYAKLCNPYMVL